MYVTEARLDDDWGVCWPAGLLLTLARLLLRGCMAEHTLRQPTPKTAAARD
jgi:hypothetical protein